jgi:large subunit ribosomal protein L21
MIEGFADQWRSKRVWAGCYRMTTCGTFWPGRLPRNASFDRVVREAGNADLIRRAAMKSTERSYMYAVVKTGGKQYKVAAGEKIKVEQIAADVGQEIVLDQVLAVGNGAELTVGAPLVAGASVKATVVAQGRHDKVRIFKMRRRKHYQKHGGHRQHFTELEISAINA